MSGSNSICVATVLLETGILPMQEPQTRLTLEAPGGVIEVVADCRDGKAERISVENVPSFADRLDAPLEVEGLGTLTVDIAYGGDSFVIVDAKALGFAIAPDEARELAELGIRITAAANEQLGFAHPENSGWDHISFCQFAGPLDAPGRRNQRPQRCRRPPWQDRPFADRNGMQRQNGDAGRARVAEPRRGLSRALDHRLRVRLPCRPRDDDRRAARPSHRSSRAAPGLLAFISTCWIRPTLGRPATGSPTPGPGSRLKVLFEEPNTRVLAIGKLNRFQRVNINLYHCSRFNSPDEIVGLNARQAILNVSG